jgi:hypothetical protein
MTDRKTASTINDAELDALYAELAALRAVARGYCPACGRGDAAPSVTDWEQQKQRADQAEERLRNIANGHPRADAIQAEIGEMIAQTHELREQLRLVDAMRQQNLDAAAAAVQRAETAERDAGIYRDRLARLTDGYAKQFRRLEAAEAAIEGVRAYAADLERAGWTGPAIARRIRQALDGTPDPAATEATDAPSWLHVGTRDLSIPDHQVDEESGPA